MIGIPGGVAIGGTPPATSTFNPSDKAAAITLSNGNLTGTGTASGGDDLVRSTNSKTTGKLYYEGTMTLNAAETALGIANSTASLTAFLGTDNNGVGLYRSGNVFIGGSNVMSGPSMNNGDIFGVAIDFGAQLIWWRNNNASTVWNAGGTANPATGVGGQSFAAITGPYFFCFDIPGTATAVATVNPGNSFNVAAPSGFSAWG